MRVRVGLEHEPRRLGTVQARHAVVHQDDVRPQLAHDGRRLVAGGDARDHLDLVAQPEEQLECLAEGVVVLHDEHPDRDHSAASRSG